MEIIQICDLCNDAHAELLFTGHDLLYGVPGEFSLVRCQECGLIYLSSRPDPAELVYYYPSTYLSYLKAIEDEKSLLHRLDRGYGRHKHIQAVIGRTEKIGTILDVGCATGIFLDGMRRLGWETYGVEPSPEASSYARKRFQLEVALGTLETVSFPEKFFDVITFWDVLEHVPSPTRTIKTSAELLKPGGWFIASVPNPDAWDARLFGNYWAGWDVPRHFNLFTLPVFEKYLDNNGFHHFEIYNFTQSHGMLTLDFQNTLSRYSVSPNLKHAIIQIIRSIPVRLLAYPLMKIAETVNKSPTMVIFARKDA